MPITRAEADRLTAKMALAIRDLVPSTGNDKSDAREPIPSTPAEIAAAKTRGAAIGAQIVDAREVGRTMPGPFEEAEKERLYQSFKARLLEELPVDPVLLALVVTRPEIRMILHPREFKLDTTTLRGRICKLVADGVITTAPIKRAEINAALSRTGATPAGNRFSEAVTSLVNEGVLVRGDDDGIYMAAPGLKITKDAIEATA